MSRTSIYFGVGLVAVSLVAGYLWGRSKVQTAYVTKAVPVTVEKPVPVHDTVYSTRTAYLPKVTTVHDTVTNTVTTIVHQSDTVQVQVPISRTTYEETLNDVWVSATVSGYEPTLERLTVENLKICPPTGSQGRFSVGVGVGYGLGVQDGLNGVFSGQPFVGVTFSYNLFSF